MVFLTQYLSDFLPSLPPPSLEKQKVSSKANLSNNADIFYNTTRYPENGSSMKEFFTEEKDKLIFFPSKKEFFYIRIRRVRINKHGEIKEIK